MAQRNAPSYPSAEQKARLVVSRQAEKRATLRADFRVRENGNCYRGSINVPLMFPLCSSSVPLMFLFYSIDVPFGFFWGAVLSERVSSWR